MRKFILRLAVNAAALYAAMYIMQGHGIAFQNPSWTSFLVLALIFGVVNAILKPILMVVGCPFIILSLGLGTLLINTLLFVLVGKLGTLFDLGFSVQGFLPAFLGALIVSIVSFLLTIVVKDIEKG